MAATKNTTAKNGYMAYKRIATWQTHLLHTRPYTAS
jgi:hypothetical protein